MGDARIRDLERELASLRNSKNSIKAITKVALACDAVEVASRISQRASSGSTQPGDDNIVLLYAVDSICKVAQFKGLADVLQAFQPTIRGLALQLATGINATQHTVNSVRKVLGYWVQRSIFSADLVGSIQSELPAGDEPKQLPKDKLVPPTKKRKATPSPQLKKAAPRESLHHSQPKPNPAATSDKNYAAAEKDRRRQDYNNRYSHGFDQATTGFDAGFDSLWSGVDSPVQPPSEAQIDAAPEQPAFEPAAVPPSLLPLDPRGAKLPVPHGLPRAPSEQPPGDFSYTPSSPAPLWTPSGATPTA